MPALDASLLRAQEQPYPGLRAFEPGESLLFFGRRSQTEELLERLGTGRFLGIVGTSGSGKSSLVRAGLIPALHRGHLAGASSRWRVALMRPGEAPILKLAEALASDEVLGGDPGELAAELGKTSLGLIRAVQQSPRRPLGNVMVVVDQFEELFRFRGRRPTEERDAEASLFVSSLLEAVDQSVVPIYVVLTMRSDFLGDCAGFHGLPEALNESQYLVPRLTREQRREAIEGPLRVAGLRVSPALVQRLLNDAGDEPAELPLLQHALMRTYHWFRGRDSNEAIELADYERAGGIDEALDRHATEVFHSLPDDRHREVAEKVFRCLTTVEKGRAVRRPSSLGTLYEVLGARAEEEQQVVRAVVERFAAKENSFLLSSSGAELKPSSILDISHESLIAKWTLLGAWLLREVKVAETYRYLSRDAGLYPKDAGLWRDPELKVAWEYYQGGEWNEAWARQYDSGGASFEEAKSFLEESRRAQAEARTLEAERRRKEIEDHRKLAAAERREKRWFMGVAVLLLLLLGAVGLSFWMYRASVQAQRRIEEARRLAEEERVELQQQIADALGQADEAKRRVANLEAAGGASAAELEDLKRQIDRYDREAMTAQEALKAQRPAADPKAEALITSLQDQLERARAERDAAVARAEQAAKAYSGTSSLRDELEAANRRIQSLEMRLADAKPTAVVLPQYSLATLKPAQYRGRVALFTADLARTKSSTADLYVLVSRAGASLPDGFVEEPRLAASLLQKLGAIECPGASELRELRVTCLRAVKGTVLRETQDLGVFYLDDQAFAVTAMGWSQNVSGGTDVLSVSVYPVVERRASAKR